eukprot:6594373-Karenia_brevis.AAC.1
MTNQQRRVHLAKAMLGSVYEDHPQVLLCLIRQVGSRNASEAFCAEASVHMKQYYVETSQ